MKKEILLSSLVLTTLVPAYSKTDLPLASPSNISGLLRTDIDSLYDMDFLSNRGLIFRSLPYDHLKVYQNKPIFLKLAFKSNKDIVDNDNLGFTYEVELIFSDAQGAQITMDDSRYAAVKIPGTQKFKLFFCSSTANCYKDDQYLVMELIAEGDKKRMVVRSTPKKYFEASSTTPFYIANFLQTGRRFDIAR